MYLINTATLKLEEFSGDVIPKYAILSHTWGDEEVTLQQFSQPDAAAKNGYSKIERMCSKSLDRGLEYAWVDTCCINKTSSAELSEAINSMFQWYEEAEVCFAYLEDVSSSGVNTAFESARWFTRGWTLQELLAPRRLEFFTSEWKSIGTREELSDPISLATGINKAYISDTGLSSRFELLRKASVAERMSWAAKRMTSRKEDIAYCLLGIFGVNMPLIYGEGMNAFLRLQEEIIRKYVDLTLLAWNTDHRGEPIPPKEPIEFSSWRSALDMLICKQHPWAAPRDEPKSLGPDMPFLAHTPSSFLGCEDIVLHHSPFNWSLTSKGLNITSLPVSQNRKPYLILPCYFRNDPTQVLCLPLSTDLNGSHLRRHVPLKLVDYRKWHQWDRRTMILGIRTGSITQVSDTHLHDVGFNLLVGKTPPGIQLCQIYSNGIWESCRESTPVHFIRVNFANNHYQLTGLLLKDKKSDIGFAIIAAISTSGIFSPLTSEILSLEHEMSLRQVNCCIIRPATCEIVQSVIETSQIKDMPRYLELQSTLTYCTIARELFLGRSLSDLSLFHITIHQSTSPIRNTLLKLSYDVTAQITKWIRNGTTTPSRMEEIGALLLGCLLVIWTSLIGAIAILIYTFLSQPLLSMAVFGPIFLGVGLSMVNGAYSNHPDGDLATILLNTYLSAIVPRLELSIIFALLTVNMLPILSCFQPRASLFLKQRKGTITISVAIIVALWDIPIWLCFPFTIWVFILTRMILWMNSPGNRWIGIDELDPSTLLPFYIHFAKSIFFANISRSMGAVRNR
ncbi:heterokaryon incompatibility protein-domain-containing protein [Hypoxylon crocopeplum]|nr:heterokaryon incompatibility protein-domain-containing protein [Hypoxylon crocopeplum]